MTQVPIDRSTNRLGAAIKDLCRSQWHEAYVGWQVVGRWTRSYSEVQLIELKTTATTRRLIAKRAVRHVNNAAHHARGDVALNELRALHQAEAALKGMPGGGVPQAHGVVAGEDWLLMEYVSGSQLDRQLAHARWLTSRQRQAAAEGHFGRLGEWLRNYQRNTATPVPIETLEATLAECQRRLTDLDTSSMAHVSSDFVVQAIARLQDCLRQIDSPLEGCSCHGDFGPWNVLVTDDSLTVIDFFCRHDDSIWIDPLNVVTYLRTQQPSISLSRRRVERLQDAFLQGYGRTLEVDRPEFQLCLAFQQICRLQDAVGSTSSAWFDRYRRWNVIRELVRQLGGQSSFHFPTRLRNE